MGTSIGRLDYSDTKILMHADTEIERSYRLNACAKEPWTTDFILRIDPGNSVFWDIGANVGPYSLLAAARGIPTVSIEPGSANFATLCNNMWLNNFDNRILPFCFALGDAAGLTWLDYQDLRSGAASHILGASTKQFFHRQLIPVISGDDLVSYFHAPAPSHIKLDVDGAELAVLAGIRGILTNVKEAMVEMPNQQSAEIISTLEASGLKFTEAFDEREGRKIGNISYGLFVRQ